MQPTLTSEPGQDQGRAGDHHDQGKPETPGVFQHGHVVKVHSVEPGDKVERHKEYRENSQKSHDFIGALRRFIGTLGFKRNLQLEYAIGVLLDVLHPEE